MTVNDCIYLNSCFLPIGRAWSNSFLGCLRLAYRKECPGMMVYEGRGTEWRKGF